MTKRGISRKMGTYVRILPRNADGMKTVRSNDERKEEEMAFSCVLYLKEECDGCGICEEERRLRLLWDEERWLRDEDD